MTEEARSILEKCNSVCEFKELSHDDKIVLISQFGTKRLKTDNTFLGKTDEVRYEIFDLPKGLTCPGKTKQCSEGCYQGQVEKMHKKDENDSAVLCWRKLNWFYSMQYDFVEKTVRELCALKPEGQPEIRVRIHASGDFYSYEYMKNWFIICAAMEQLGKKYKFVAYTKSFEFLDCLLKDQNELKSIMRYAYKLAGKNYESDEDLKLEDFNIHIIASIMDDTKAGDIEIAEKYKLPKYIVTEHDTGDLHVCKKEGETCADCSKCYEFPMEDVKTILRS